MNKADIQVGESYANRGKGFTRRKVLGIGKEFRSYPVNALEVLYEQDGQQRVLSLSAFARWAGRRVGEGSAAEDARRFAVMYEVDRFALTISKREERLIDLILALRDTRPMR